MVHIGLSNQLEARWIHHDSVMKYGPNTGMVVAMNHFGDAIHLVREQTRAQEREQLSDEELIDGVRDSESLVRAITADQLAMVAEAERRGLHTSEGGRTLKSWIQDLLRLSGSDANTRAILARKIDRTESADESSVELPDTAEAMDDGAIGLDHARAISDGVRKLASGATPAEQAEAETLLAGQARFVGPRDVRVLADRLRYERDQDGAHHDEEQQVARRELHLGTNREGMLTLHGQLDREAGAALRTALEPLAKPQPTDDGEPDPRSAAKRNADALVQLLDGRAAESPAGGGIRRRVVVTIGLHALTERIGGGTLEATGEPLSATSVRRMACDAEIIPVVLGGHGEPLDIGRAQQSVPRHLRRLLLVRDGSCAFPGCDRPLGASHAHHCQHWAEGGKTAIDNLVMLCAGHHRHLHAENWLARINPHGLPEFIPPRAVDPSQTPRSGSRADIGELPTSS